MDTMDTRHWIHWINLGSKDHPFNPSGHVPWHAKLPPYKLQFECSGDEPSTPPLSIWKQVLPWVPLGSAPIFPCVIRTNNLWATLRAKKTWGATIWRNSLQPLPCWNYRAFRLEMLYDPLSPCKACTRRCHCWALQLRTSRTLPSFKSLRHEGIQFFLDNTWWE